MLRKFIQTWQPNSYYRQHFLTIHYMKENGNRKRKININHWYKICECLWANTMQWDTADSACFTIRKTRTPILSLSGLFVAVPVTVFVHSFDRLAIAVSSIHARSFCSIPPPLLHFLVVSFISLALVRILCRKRICVRWLPAVRFCKGDHSVYHLFLSMHIHSNADPNHCVLMEMEKRIICNQTNEQTNKHKNHRKRNWVVWWWCCFTYARRAHLHITHAYAHLQCRQLHMSNSAYAP